MDYYGNDDYRSGNNNGVNSSGGPVPVSRPNYFTDKTHRSVADEHRPDRRPDKKPVKTPGTDNKRYDSTGNSTTGGNTDRRPAVPDHTPRQKRKLTPKGKLKRVYLPIFLALVAVITIFTVVARRASTVTVSADKVSYGNMESIYQTKGLLVNSNGIFHIVFIDNDYLIHGITNTTSAYILNPSANNEKINCNVSGISGCEPDDEKIVTLESFLGTSGVNEQIVTEEQETLAEDEEPTGENAEQEEAEDEENYGDDLQYIVSLSIVWPVEKEFPISANTVIDVFMVTTAKSDTTFVPVNCVFNSEGKDYVIVIDNGKAVWTQVTTGVTTSTSIELLNTELAKDTPIVSGVTDGRQLGAIKDGTRIKIEKPSEDEK